MSSLFNKLTQMVPNDQARSLLQSAGSFVQERMATTSFGSANRDEYKIEVVNKKRLEKMLKMDTLNSFSCHSESVSGVPKYHVIYLPASKIVYSNDNEKEVRQMCKKLDSLAENLNDPQLLNAKLEELMRVVWANPDWSPIHYGCALGFVKLINELFKKDAEAYLKHATPDGQFPLQIAASAGQLETVQFLVSHGACLTQKDAYGRTVVHWAAEKNANVLKELVTVSKPTEIQKCLEEVDGDGISPLGAAIKAANLDAVKILMGLGAPLGPLPSGPLLNVLVDLDHSESLSEIIRLVVSISPTVVMQADARGRTILHRKLRKKVLLLLLQFSHKYIDINKKDNDGLTALHYAVTRCRADDPSEGDIETVTALLSYGADVNIVNSLNETPLMLAAHTTFRVTVMTLLLFGADLNMKNANQQTVFAYSATSKRRADIEELLHAAEEMQKPSDANKPISTMASSLHLFQQRRAFEHQKKLKSEGRKSINGLALDGGGVKGLLIIQILLELEEKYGKSLIAEFDWICGTSTGAILALALAQNRPLLECRRLYFRLKDHIFIGKRPCDEQILEAYLKEEFGEKTTLDMIPVDGKKVFVTTCIANVSPPILKLFRSYSLSKDPAENQQMGFDNPKEITAWKAARCSSAAPTYFKAVMDESSGRKFMDGGLMANNPSRELFSEIDVLKSYAEMKGEAAETLGCILSIGTGKIKPKAANNVDLGGIQTSFFYL
ncbi:hypothetical protein WR25_15841 [Diploscapter pachys]|uniref:phospholipase A2 n=1 Tax=Diploscapter pachys TaxID=2018661 RepID=A0A2A2J7F4_9BILA|nr:hypothetical protein WR25_15841 [Diploscapter pachys]